MESLFAKQASTYAKIRPTYPASMVQMLANLTPQHHHAWDVGTGNGQAAAMLAEHYRSVVATDLSEEQLSFAVHHPKVTYSKMSATPPSMEELERVVGGKGSVDLVTVAQAMHWFDLEKFYSVVKHVLRKPGGVIAAWCYGNPTVTPEVDKVIYEVYRMSGPYWAPPIRYIEEGYRTIPFPFDAAREDGVGPHTVDVPKQWSLDDLMLYWSSCSAVQTARDKGVDLVSDEIRKMVSDAWGGEHVRTVTFHLKLLVGTVRFET
ncbi:unnamed protein product [Calypogeia fissa]